MNLTEAQLAHLILAFHEGTLTVAEQQLLQSAMLDNPEIAADLNLPRHLQCRMKPTTALR